MKKIRLFSLVAAVLMSGIMLVGCGEKEAYNPSLDSNTYAGLSATEVYDYARESILMPIINLEDTQIDYFITNADELISQGVVSQSVVNRVSDWKEMKPLVGDFIALGEYTISENDGVIVATQVAEFANGDATLTLTFDAETSDIISIVFEKNKTLGEKMLKAGQNTLMGIGTVFVMLIVMCLVITAFKIIPIITGKIEQRKKDNEVTEPVEDSEFVKQVTQREELATDSLELVAVIAAAIAAATGTTTDDFVVRSIKRRN